MFRSRSSVKRHVKIGSCAKVVKVVIASAFLKPPAKQTVLSLQKNDSKQFWRASSNRHRACFSIQSVFRQKAKRKERTTKSKKDGGNTIANHMRATSSHDQEKTKSRIDETKFFKLEMIALRNCDGMVE